jgi:signal transduction histidine kinase
MKPLNLYTRTTLLVSALLTAVLLVVVYFFISTTRDIERHEQEELTRQWAGHLADRLSNTVDLAAQRSYAQVFMDAHDGEIEEIRVYASEKKRSLHEVISVPERRDSEDAQLQKNGGKISDSDLARLAKGATISRIREVELKGEKWRVIYAVAPMLDKDKKDKTVFEGAVSLTIRRRIFSTLSRRLVQLTMALLAAAIISIIAQLYFLFSQIILRPVSDLLQTMSKVKSGNLDVTVPVRARDEFGRLATDFNHMISRLRAMTAEREAYQKSLEERVQDATAELAERNAQLEEVNAALFEMQRELTQFERLAAAGQLAAQFAHEVGTPLNLISGHVQLLSARTEDPKTRERLDLIGSQIARIERIVRNMLDATKRPLPELAPLDLNALLRRIFEVTAPTLAARQVELITTLDEANPSVSGDGEQLQQVFINLINNSLDAMPQGGQLTFKTESIAHTVRVTCRDTGTGISEEIRSRIFDPLFTTKQRGRGSGLGLTVVHQIIREHNGAITLKSESGAGAEFQITLPLAAAEVVGGQWSAVSENTIADQTGKSAEAETQSLITAEH